MRNGNGPAIVTRFSEITDWIKEGHTLAIIGAPKISAVRYIQNHRNLLFDPLASSEIFQGISFRHTTGTLVEYCGPSILSDTFSQIVGSLSYDAVLSGTALTSLYRVSTPIPGETQLVGAYKTLGKGVVTFLPPLTSAGPHSAEFYLYHLAAASILESLKNPAQEEFPEWLPQFPTAMEESANRQILDAHKKIQDIEADIAESQGLIASERSAKLLFTATGDVFTAAVAAGLRELGLSVVEGPKQRADLIVWDGKRLAAVEVKGLEGPAREKNVGQVKRWTADVSVARSLNDDDQPHDTELASYRDKLAELGIPPTHSAETPDCKGIVILGTYRKIPLDQRLESFLDPVKRVINRSNVCALTGLQLFTVLQEVRASPSRRESIIDALFNTDGVLDDGRQWQTYLQKI